MISSALGTAIAAAAAVLFAVGAVVQQEVAARASSDGQPDVRRLLTSRAWLGGQVATVAAVVLQVVALGLAPVSVVQPLLAGGLVVALGIRSVRDRSLPSGTDLVGAALTAGGLAVFLVAARPAAMARDHGPGTLAVLAAVFLALALVALAGRAKEGPRGWGAVATGIAAQFASQQAFARGSLSWSLPVLTVAGPLAAVPAARILLGERLEAGHATVWVPAGIVAAVGVVLLARSREGRPGPGTRQRRVRTRTGGRTPALVLVGLLVLVLSSVGIGAAPAQAATSPYARTLAVAGLADPVVYKAGESLYFLSGTSSKNFLPIYRSTDLHTFSLLRGYDPNPLDRAYDYCNEWAPELIKRGGLFYLYFTATRVAKGATCPSGNTQPTIFYATAPATNFAMQFGAPRMINQNTAYPQTFVAAGCPPAGCDKALRLDPSVYFDGARWWMHYAWFDPVAGPTVSAFPMDAPASSFEVTRPTTAAEQGVNEAPDLFARSGQQYLMYSQGNYQGAYAMRYFVGATVADLTRGHPLHTFSSPLTAHDGRLLENEGHNTVTTHNGQFFTLYHAARFSPPGAYAGRDVYLQRLMFHPDGTLQTLNTVTLSWTATANSTYSVDVLTRSGTWISGCMSAGAGSSVTYNEVCTGAGDQVVHKAEVAAFRVNRSSGGTTVAGTKITYDGYSDSLSAAV